MANIAAIKSSIKSGELKFHVPPVCQGQIVERAFACDGDFIYEKITDKSDRSVTVVVYDHPEDANEGSFEPWNSEPDCGDEVARIEGIES
jgi:hypothetical protein